MKMRPHKKAAALLLCVLLLVSLVPAFAAGTENAGAAPATEQISDASSQQGRAAVQPETADGSTAAEKQTEAKTKDASADTAKTPASAEEKTASDASPAASPTTAGDEAPAAMTASAQVTANIALSGRVITDVMQRRFQVTSGQTETLTALITGWKEAQSAWRSNNPAVAQVAADGRLTFTGSTGYAYITLSVTGTDAQGHRQTVSCGVTYYASVEEKTVSQEEYPSYPEEGAVRLDKSAQGIDFQTTGVAQVELAVDGVPVRHQKDVVVVVDLSSSMTDTVGGKTRVAVVNAALKNLVAQLMTHNSDGTASQTRVAVVAFNNYDYDTISAGNNLLYSTGENHRGYNHTNNILTGTGTASGAFVGADKTSDLQRSIEEKCVAARCSSGTNYDLAMQTAYEILYMAGQQSGYDREQSVIFMSDGAPFQYNDFRGYSGNGGPAGTGTAWMAWLSGDEAQRDVQKLLKTNAYAPNYFNTDGQLNWALAIRGGASSRNLVVDPYNTALSAIAYTDSQLKTKSVPGLGAEVYAVGFCLAPDGEITRQSEEGVLQRLSSGTGHTYFANDASELSNVFGQIADSLFYAAANASVTDTLGADYTLLTDAVLQSGSNRIDLTEGTYIGQAPYVEIGRWTLSDAGERQTYTAMETITFGKDASGNAAAWSSDMGSENILRAGTVHGAYVTYDTKTSQFTWNIGTVYGNTQYTLRYFVSLKGALEGTRQAGSYDTNQGARLSYVNYLGHDCTRDFPVPSLAWQAVNVTYEFYVVNADGLPVNSNGAVVTFANRQTCQRGTQTILLNSDNELLAAGLFQGQQGYTLYSPDTAYYLHVGSGSQPSLAYIRDVGTPQTTRVFQPAATHTEDSFLVGDRLYNLAVGNVTDYTNTHVAFAVTKAPELTQCAVKKVWNGTAAHPDAVLVQLYAGEEPWGEPVTLSADNGWTYTWEGLRKYAYVSGMPTDQTVSYSVREEIPKGYTAAYGYDAGSAVWTVTNTPVSDQDLTLPQTGGRGTAGFWITGTVLLLTGGAWLYLRRREETTNET